MSMNTSRNLVKEFIKTVEKNPNKKILSDKKNYNWNKIDRKDLYNKISQGIYVLKDNNIKKGDRVAYKGKNSIDWVAWNMSCYAVGATWVLCIIIKIPITVIILLMIVNQKFYLLIQIII